jgi:hypothetical protein
VVSVRASLAQALIEGAEEANRQGMEIVRRSEERIRKRQSEGLETEVFPMLWLFEYYYGPTLMSPRIDWDELWDLRVQSTRQLVERLRRREDGAGADHMEPLLWESILGFWLVHDDDHAEAEPLLRANLAAWRQHLDADDPWLRHVEALHACAVVNRHVDLPPLGRLPAGEREPDGDASPPVVDWPSPMPEDLRAALATLEAIEPEIAATHGDTPLHQVVERALGR